MEDQSGMEGVRVLHQGWLIHVSAETMPILQHFLWVHIEFLVSPDILIISF